MSKIEYCREDPIFRLRTPLLFAHRGGALEVPESTKKAFCYAFDVGTDVLELDVQLTKDGKFVLWHGPSLENVRISGQPDNPSKRHKNRRKIQHFLWDELCEKAWVANPGVKNLAKVKKDPDRHLMLFSDFLRDEEFKDKPINIELKGTFEPCADEKRPGLTQNLKLFTEILKTDPERKMVIVSLHHRFIKKFRELTGDAYCTGLSFREQLYLRLSMNIEKKNRALETSYDTYISSKRIVDNIREKGGSTYVFVTRFPFIPALDKHENIDEAAVFGILDRGVDGIMTDRPGAMRGIIDQWKQMVPLRRRR